MAGGPTVGLDIGTKQIKAVEVRRGNNGVQVTAIGVAPTPQEAFENNVIVDAQALGQAIKELLRQSGISSRQCVSSVSGQSVVVRVIDVPRMSYAELAETMKWEVDRQAPFPADQVIMDFQPIERPDMPADAQNMEVLLAIAQQDMIDRHIDMLFAAGLKPVAIDVEPLAAGRCLLELGNGANPPGHTVAIVNLGASNTDIGIWRDKLLSFPRTLPLAGDHLTHAIANALQVDLGTAEEYKRTHGEVLLDQMQAPPPPDFGTAAPGDFGGFVDFTAPPAPTAGPTTTPSRVPFDFTTATEAPSPTEPNPFDVGAMPATPFDQPAAPTAQPGADTGFVMPEFGAAPPPANLPAPVPSSSTGESALDTLRTQIFNAMAPVLVDLVAELRRSLDYYRGKTGDAPIHEILLTGGTAKLKNLAPYLERELGIPTRVADPLHTIQITSRNFSQGHLEEIASLFPVSIGLGAYNLVSAPAAVGKKR
ncbi:MAG TPA: type IV pilus assembly protein PilM [Chthonomonadaceae bacterium]|nr:type IV pilus assembly protein PilM [Chthonomonadaceae bacterium]